MVFGLTLVWIIISIVVIILVLYFVIIYNGLISLKNNIEKAWSNIDVLLKQRSDELPNLVESVKGYMKHEKSTLLELTKARTEFLKAETLSQKAKADKKISGALKTIFAVAENYPKLRANENFLQLQNRISGLENEIADRREFYNDSVTNYNTRIQSVPDVWIAKMFGFTEPKQLFKATEEEKKNVKIDI